MFYFNLVFNVKELQRTRMYSFNLVFDAIPQVSVEFITKKLIYLFKNFSHHVQSSLCTFRLNEISSFRVKKIRSLQVS